MGLRSLGDLFLMGDQFQDCDSQAVGALPEASAALADLPCGCDDAGATSCVRSLI